MRTDFRNERKKEWMQYNNLCRSLHRLTHTHTHTYSYTLSLSHTLSHTRTLLPLNVVRPDCFHSDTTDDHQLSQELKKYCDSFLRESTSTSMKLIAINRHLKSCQWSVIVVVVEMENRMFFDSSLMEFESLLFNQNGSASSFSSDARTVNERSNYSPEMSSINDILMTTNQNDMSPPSTDSW